MRRFLCFCLVLLCCFTACFSQSMKELERRKKQALEQLALTNKLLEETKKRGTTRLILEVRASNEPAIRLYEKFGFKIQGVRKNFYDMSQSYI